MKTISVPCNNCGASIHLATQTNFLNCNYCGSSLKVIRSSGSTFTEVLEGIDEKTSQIAQDTRIIRIQNDLEILEREWKKQEAELMIKDGENRLEVPSTLTGQITGFLGLVVLLGFGIWAYKAEMAMLFVFGLFFSLILFALASNHTSKAEKYEDAKSNYEGAKKELTEALEKARASIE